MACPECGTANTEGAKFCLSCGHSFVTPVEEPAPEVWEERDIEVTSPLVRERQETTALDPPYGQREDGDFVPYQSVEEATVTTTGGSRVPVLAVALVALFVILGTLVAVWLSLMGERGPGANSAEVTPTPVEPASLLFDSTEAMAGVQTMRYQSEVLFHEQPTPGVTATPLVVNISGDIRRPDSYTMNTDSSEVGQYVVIGPTTWVRHGGSPTWVELPTGEVSLGPLNPLAVPLYMQFYEPNTPQHVGTETRGGELLHHLKFDVDTQRMANASGSDTFRARLAQMVITAEVWIRDRDRLLDSVAILVDTRDGNMVEMRTFLSRYNAEVNIGPPDGATP